MKKTGFILTSMLMASLFSCKPVQTGLDVADPSEKIIFLHHSTGRHVWYGDVKQDKKVRLKEEICMVPRLFNEYNDNHDKRVSIVERNFPSGDPYPWNNYPFDYYNIWVKNAGSTPYMEEPTLEMLTQEYDIIVFKHCFPVSNIVEDDGNPDINSEVKTLANYKLQYNALKEKLKEYPDTKFVVWTGAALLEISTNEGDAKRADAFFKWVRTEWDEPDDNISVFDFRSIETDGGIYLEPGFSKDPSWDSHPNRKVSAIAAKQFVDHLIQLIEN